MVDMHLGSCLQLGSNWCRAAKLNDMSMSPKFSMDCLFSKRQGLKMVDLIKFEEKMSLGSLALPSDS